MEKLKNDPASMEELLSETNQQVRSQIVRAVRKHCIDTGRTYPEAWYSVYQQFEKETGICLRRCVGKKLDFVEKQGLLVELFRIIHTLLSPEVENIKN